MKWPPVDLEKRSKVAVACYVWFNCGYSDGLELKMLSWGFLTFYFPLLECYVRKAPRLRMPFSKVPVRIAYLHHLHKKCFAKACEGRSRGKGEETRLEDVHLEARLGQTSLNHATFFLSVQYFPKRSIYNAHLNWKPESCRHKRLAKWMDSFWPLPLRFSKFWPNSEQISCCHHRLNSNQSAIRKSSICWPPYICRNPEGNWIKFAKTWRKLKQLKPWRNRQSATGAFLLSAYYVSCLFVFFCPLLVVNMCFFLCFFFFWFLLLSSVCFFSFLLACLLLAVQYASSSSCACFFLLFLLLLFLFFFAFPISCIVSSYVSCSLLVSFPFCFICYEKT